MGEVVDLPVITRLDTDPERILERARTMPMKHLVIVGYAENGDEVFLSSFADGSEALWLLMRGQKKLLDIADRI